MDWNINFPHLGIELPYVPKTFSVFGMEVALYGVMIGLGMLVAIYVIQAEAKRTGQSPDDYFNITIFAIIIGIIGARLYYVAFSWDMYKDDLLSIFNIRQGGLAIYGGILAGILAVYFVAKRRKMVFMKITDTMIFGVIIGQIMGRWGNFFNREAFGEFTDSLFAMQLPVSAVRSADISENLAAHILNIDGISYLQVHPTFLYESVFNLLLLFLMLWYRKRKKFDGEIFLLYLGGYGIIRFFIEGLRTDQLLIPGIGLPVSQILGLALAVLASIIWMMAWKKQKQKG